MKLKGRKKLASHVLIGVLALSIGATATVAAGIAGGVITACENLATGILRVETTNAPCVVSGSPILARAPLLLEERITWNQVGPQGMTGPRGATGPNGDPGAQGPAGPTGAVGATGPAGAAGATGAPGPKGDNGMGLVWRGQYQSSQAYAVDDAVQSQGSAYVATAALAPISCGGSCVDSNAPGLNSAWQILAGAGAKGENGNTGPAGDTGPQGPAGPSGPGLSGYEIVDTGFLAAPGLQASQGVATCSPGKRVLGGGVFGAAFLMTIYGSLPDNSWDAWIGRVYNADVITLHYKVYAICVTY